VQKISDEIERLKRKIDEYQNRLKELQRQKTELENADIVAMVRGIDIPPDEFAAFVRMFKERENCAVPDLAPQEEGKTSINSGYASTVYNAEENDEGGLGLED
jgi:hypothetical protein